MPPRGHDYLESSSEWDEIRALVPAQVITRINGKEIKTKTKNTYWGHRLKKEKEENRIRVYFQNINGIRKTNMWDNFQFTLEKIKEYNIDVFAFVETNIPWTPKNKYRARVIGRRTFTNVKMEMSSSNEPALNDYQPGGTLIGTQGKNQGRVISGDADQHGLGRWSYVCLTGMGTKVYIISAYRVAQEENDGIHTAYIQQYRIMRSRGIEQPNPRKQWCTDLAMTIKRWKKEGEVLLLTDANSVLNDTRFSNFVTEVGLFDILGQMHGIGGINSHIRGTKRIVFALGTYRITRAVVRGGMLPFHHMLVSDHRGMFLDINAKHIFKGEIHALYNAPQQKVTAKYAKHNKQYRKQVTARIQMCGLVQKVDDHLEAIKANNKKMQRL